MLLIGTSGSGKTTLLRRIAAHTPAINCRLEDGLKGVEDGVLTSDLHGFGYVWQDPDAQMVCHKVEQEIVFGMENLGTPAEDMRRRLAEVVTFFGLEALLHRETDSLSAGEKQTVNIAGAMAMKPELLLLDEPTSALDPMAAERLVGLIRKIHEETGVTIVIAEQRPELFFEVADRIVVMDEGDAVFADDYRAWLRQGESPFMSRSLRMALQTGADPDTAISRRKRRSWLINHTPDTIQKDHSDQKHSSVGQLPDEKNWQANSSEKSGLDKHADIVVKNISFRYNLKSPDVLTDCSLSLKQGEITALVGGNGSGKTTLAEIIGGYLKPYAGKVRRASDTVSYLPANPAYLFTKDVDELSGGESEMRGIRHVLDRDAYVYILDEPTKGLDPDKKEEVRRLLQEKKKENKVILLVTHDIEFASACADTMAMMFDGRVVTCEKTKEFLEGNVFYTTEWQRLLSWA